MYKTKRRHKTMKRLFNIFEKLFTAVTFAEAGEFETARAIIREIDERQPIIRKDIRLYAQGR
jgi:hypothetical protein